MKLREFYKHDPPINLDERKYSPQQRAKWRVCASCRWIFNHGSACSQCGYGSYGARYVYGPKVYRLYKTQKPWKDQKIDKCLYNLEKVIRESQTNHGEK